MSDIHGSGLKTVDTTVSPSSSNILECATLSNSDNVLVEKVEQATKAAGNNTEDTTSKKGQSTIQSKLKMTPAKAQNYLVACPSSSNILESATLSISEKALVEKATIAGGNNTETDSKKGQRTIQSKLKKTPAKAQDSLVPLAPHGSSVSSLLICGRLAFTSSEDGFLHIHDLSTNALLLEINIGVPTKWLYGFSLDITKDENQEAIESIKQRLSNFVVITGTDRCIRRFDFGNVNPLRHETISEHFLSCVTGCSDDQKLYIGSEDGDICSYNWKTDELKIVHEFKAKGAVCYLKIFAFREVPAIVVAGKKSDPIIFDLESRRPLLNLNVNQLNSPFYQRKFKTFRCVANIGDSVYGCDVNNVLFQIDTRRDEIFTFDLPSAAIDCQVISGRFLVLICEDGHLRVLDLLKKGYFPIYTLPNGISGKVTSGFFEKGLVLRGSASGAVDLCSLPNLNQLSRIKSARSSQN